MSTTRRAFPIDLMRRIRREYLETPGLSLTVAQVRRFWGVDRAHCAVALAALVDAGLLSRRGDGRYVRSHVGLPAAQAMQSRAAPWDCCWAEPVLIAPAPLWVETFCGGWTCLRDGQRTLDVRDCLACPHWEPRLPTRRRDRGSDRSRIVAPAHDQASG